MARDARPRRLRIYAAKAKERAYGIIRQMSDRAIHHLTVLAQAPESAANDFLYFTYKKP